MSEKDRLHNAINLIMQGQRKEAAAELLALEKIITDKNLRIQLIDAALSALDPVSENDKLIKLSEEAIAMTDKNNRKDLQAFFTSRKADFLMGKMTFLLYGQANLKLSPDWTAFSTEEDKKEYEALTAEAEKTESEINTLLRDALMLAEQSNSKQVVARILMSSASIDSARYLHYKMECMRGGLRTKLWVKFELLRHPFFEKWLVYSKEKTDKLNGFLKSFTDKFLNAAHILDELNDSLAGYAYHNLANDLKSAYRFGKAKKYLLKAKAMAERHNDYLLKKQVELLGKAINARNGDIPDYINGEIR
jgi:cell division protein FtsB